jgi:hypothetical protein
MSIFHHPDVLCPNKSSNYGTPENEPGASGYVEYKKLE